MMTPLKEKTLVLGAGPSGLAYLMQNPNAVALGGKQPGGQFSTTRTLGPQVVWKTPRTEKLIKDLGLPNVWKNVKIGFHHPNSNGSVFNYPWDDSKLMRATYARKTRMSGDNKTFMSRGKTTFKAWSGELDFLVRKMLQKVGDRVLKVNAIKIDTKQQTVEDHNADIHDYSQLISTLPAPTFYQMAGLQKEVAQFKGFDKWYVLCKMQHLPFWIRSANTFKFNYVYVADLNFPFHRVKFNGDGTAVLEYTIVPGSKKSLGVNPVAVISKRHQPKGQVIRGLSVPILPANVTALGRYAQWNQGMKLDEVLDRIEYGS